MGKVAAPKALVALAAALSGLHVASGVPVQTNSSELEFDYVIVGAGPGGLTLATRLSEDPSVSVAVIEAGTWSTSVTGNQSQVPAYDYFYNGKSPNDTNPLVEWGFVTTPQAVRAYLCLECAAGSLTDRYRVSTDNLRTTLVANP